MSENTIPGALGAAKERWRLDKTISGQALVVLILTTLGGLLANIGIMLWLARGEIAAREQLQIDQLRDRERIVALEESLKDDDRQTSVLAGRIAVIEANSASTQAAVLRVEADVKTLIRESRR